MPPTSALLVLLFQAERDWSYAQALKQDVTEEPRKRFHLIKRLRRAAAHARALEAVCTALGDRVTPRTLLDVQAYAHYLDGLVHLETQQWEAALDAMIRARALLTRLAATGTPQQAALCNARIEEVDPSIRYSAYNLGAPWRVLCGVATLAACLPVSSIPASLGCVGAARPTDGRRRRAGARRADPAAAQGRRRREHRVGRAGGAAGRRRR